MRTYTGSVQGTCPDANIWLQERMYMTCKTSAVSGYNDTWRTTFVRLYDSADSLLGEYAVDANFETIIDITDFLRSFGMQAGVGTAFSIKVLAYWALADLEGANAVLSFTAVGLLNPDHLFVPYDADAQAMTQALGVNKANAFAFPNVILRSAGADQLGLLAYGVTSGVVALKSTTGRVDVWKANAKKYVLTFIFTTTTALIDDDVEDWMQGVYDYFGAVHNVSISEFTLSSSGGVYTVAATFTYLGADTYAEAQMVARRVRVSAGGQGWANYEYVSDDINQVTNTGSVKYLWGTSVATNSVTGNFVTLEAGSTAKCVALTDAAGNVLVTRALRDQLCDREYVLVSWVDATGVATKQAVFEARERKTGADGQINLESIQYTFAYVKGREDEITLVLQGLTRYDMWYYSDLLTSSDVRIAGEPVSIETKEVSIPDGNGGGLVDFKVKVKVTNFDAIKL